MKNCMCCKKEFDKLLLFKETYEFCLNCFVETCNNLYKEELIDNEFK